MDHYNLKTKYKKRITKLVFLLLTAIGVHAQEAITTIGGEATGTGGTASYSVGQVVYTTNTGTNGSVAQGVQQAYEISTVLSVNDDIINLKLSIYPNPTVNFLTLKVEGFDNLSYELYDIQGRILETKMVRSNATRINLERYSAATYFFNVVKNNKIVKTFKVVKNN